MEKIKPVGYLKTTKTGKSHIPELIRRETSTGAGEKIPYVINARTVLLYDPKLTAQELIASLDVMKQDVLLRRQNARLREATRGEPAESVLCRGIKEVKKQGG